MSLTLTYVAELQHPPAPIINKRIASENAVCKQLGSSLYKPTHPVRTLPHMVLEFRLRDNVTSVERTRLKIMMVKVLGRENQDSAFKKKDYQERMNYGTPNLSKI